MRKHEIAHAIMLRRCKLALLRGARQLSATRILWELHISKETGEVRCDEPIKVTHYSRPVGDPVTGLVHVRPGRYKPLELTYVVPCASCARKLRKRRMFARALHETKSAFARGCRTWFCTLTCSPSYLYTVRLGATVVLAAKGVNFEALSPTEQFGAKDRVVYRDIQKFLKRLRIAPRIDGVRQKGARFVYLCVPEAHPGPGPNEGEPHYHLLMHEVTADRPIRQRVLKGANWIGGFSDYRLVEENDKTIGYVCKYLQKQSGGRVRSSTRYGSSRDGSGIAKSASKMERSKKGATDTVVKPTETSDFLAPPIDGKK